MYACPPLLPVFFCWQLLVGREENLQWNEAPSLQLLLPSSAAVRQPQCRPALGWLHGDLRKELKRQKAAQERESELFSASSIHLTCNLLAQGAPVPAGWGVRTHTPWPGRKWALWVQRSLSRMVELKLKGCWYKLSLCWEYLIWLWSICGSLCVCGQESSYDCIFLFVWGLCAGL